MPENSIMYLNQGYQSWKDNKKVYYADYFLIGQVNECLNPPKNLETYEFKDTIPLQVIFRVFMKLWGI